MRRHEALFVPEFPYKIKMSPNIVESFQRDIASSRLVVVVVENPQESSTRTSLINYINPFHISLLRSKGLSYKYHRYIDYKLTKKRRSENEQKVNKKIFNSNLRH